jgi:hypothetical protein
MIVSSTTGPVYHSKRLGTALRALHSAAVDLQTSVSRRPGALLTRSVQCHVFSALDRWQHYITAPLPIPETVTGQFRVGQFHRVQRNCLQLRRHGATFTRAASRLGATRR